MQLIAESINIKFTTVDIYGQVIRLSMINGVKTLSMVLLLDDLE